MTIEHSLYLYYSQTFLYLGEFSPHEDLLYLLILSLFSFLSLQVINMDRVECMIEPRYFFLNAGDVCDTTVTMMVLLMKLTIVYLFKI